MAAQRRLRDTLLDGDVDLLPPPCLEPREIRDQRTGCGIGRAM
jgi:hypothetical protein